MIGTIEHEVTEAYASLKRAIRRGDERSATQIVQSLLSSQDAGDVWKFLLEMSSSEVSHSDRHTAIFVRTMYDDWMSYQKPVFAVNAVLALTSATKGTSAQDYISRRID